MRDSKKLKDACDGILNDPQFLPSQDTTHCNQAAQRVAAAMGCNEFDGPMLADEMIGLMENNSSGLWSHVFGSQAAVWAQGGGLAFAVMSSKHLCDAHGHIAAVYPAPMQMSGSLGHPVPMVANVGKTNALMKASAAFPVSKGEAMYFVWNG